MALKYSFYLFLNVYASFKITNLFQFNEMCELYNFLNFFIYYTVCGRI